LMTSWAPKRLASLLTVIMSVASERRHAYSKVPFQVMA
jgi:hypothetical protein